LRELGGARERELELIEHELAEIDDAAPREGELERLRSKRERLRNLDVLLAAAGQAAEALAGGQGFEGGGVEAGWGSGSSGALALSAEAAARLDAVAGCDPALDALAVRARALAIEADDLAGELRSHGERLLAETGMLVDSGMRAKRVSPESVEGECLPASVEAAGAEEGPGGLHAVEGRLAALERLMRKHGSTIAEVLEYGEAARSRREELLGAGVALEETTALMEAAARTLRERVEALRAARTRAAPRLAAAVREQLATLAMPDATFAVELTPCEPGPRGGDAVELQIAPNPGVPAAPLREIASGGELSRVMLALTTVHDGEGALDSAALDATNGVADQATLVFDEVDAGIGGHTARAVGERLRDLAAARQVLCITHLPQIASLAERHFSVVKETAAGETRTSVLQLAEPEVLSELVRMLGAPERDTSARRHARELRRAA
jgi:DNA repair protein RecN (Recombination protein N)